MLYALWEKCQRMQHFLTVQRWTQRMEDEPDDILHCWIAAEKKEQKHNKNITVLVMAKPREYLCILRNT